MTPQDLQRLVALIRGRRWAALATQGDEGPEASWVAYVPEPDFSGFLLHLSRLARHSRNLLNDPHACLAISEPDRDDRDPQTLARVAIRGVVEMISRGSAEYDACGRRYRERLPEAEPLFGFEDFMLLRLRPAGGQFVAGFGRIYSYQINKILRIREP